MASFAQHSNTAPSFSYATHPIIRDIFIANANHPKSITLIWVPSHSGITGNDTADFLARQALQNPIRTTLNIHNTSRTQLESHFNPSLTTNDLNSFLRLQETSITLAAWRNFQHKRAQTNDSFLLNCKPNIQRLTAFDNFKRYTQIKLFRLALEHTNVTHSHLFNSLPQNEDFDEETATNTSICFACREQQVSVIHLIDHCPAFTRIRQQFGGISINNNLFGNHENIITLVNFLKQTDLFNKI